MKTGKKLCFDLTATRPSPCLFIVMCEILRGSKKAVKTFDYDNSLQWLHCDLDLWYNLRHMLGRGQQLYGVHVPSNGINISRYKFTKHPKYPILNIISTNIQIQYHWHIQIPFHQLQLHKTSEYNVIKHPNSIWPNHIQIQLNIKIQCYQTFEHNETNNIQKHPHATPKSFKYKTNKYPCAVANKLSTKISEDNVTNTYKYNATNVSQYDSTNTQYNTMQKKYIQIQCHKTAMCNLTNTLKYCQFVIN